MFRVKRKNDYFQNIRHLLIKKEITTKLNTIPVRTKTQFTVSKNLKAPDRNCFKFESGTVLL